MNSQASDVPFVKLDFCEVVLRNDGIIQIDIFPASEITARSVQQMIDACLSLTGGIPYPVIIFVGEFSSFSKDAREFSATPEGKAACTAEAYVIDNLGHYLVGSIYLKVNKPVKPVAFFYNKNHALKWLQNFKVTGERTS